MNLKGWPFEPLGGVELDGVGEGMGLAHPG